MATGERTDRDEWPFPSDRTGDVLGWLLSEGPWIAFATDECGCVTWWNDRLTAVTGRDRTCLDGLPAAELFAADPGPARDGLCAAVGGSDGVVLDVRAADGRTLPHEFCGTARTDTDGCRYLYVGRPTGERAGGADGSSRHRRIVETIHDGVFTLGADWNLIDVNRPLASMLGYDRADLVGTHATELIAPDGSIECARGAWEALQRGEVESGSVELTIVRADGSTFPAEVRYGRFSLSDGGVGAVGVARDVTEREGREARLRDHRDQLARLNRIGDAAAAALDPVLDAGSREEIERRVCARLADTDLYDLVWVGRPEGDSLVPQVTLGADSRFHELADRMVEASVHERTAERACQRGEPIVRHDAWDTEVSEIFREAVDADLRATMAVPLAYRGTTYGVLTAYSTREDAFSEGERRALVRLGRAVGFAISAIGTRRLLHAHERTELEFDVGPEASVLAAVSAALDAECVLVWSTPATDFDERTRSSPSESSPHDLWLRVAVEGVGADAVLDAVDEVGVVESRVAEARETGCTVEIRAARSVPGYVVDAGGWPREVVADGGRVRVVAEVPADADIRSVAEAFTDATGADLAAKRSLGSRPEGGSLAAALTEKQREATRTAAAMGYFDWPREHTAEEVAERLDIASATFHYHLRAAQRNLVYGALDVDDRETQ